MSTNIPNVNDAMQPGSKNFIGYFKIMSNSPHCLYPELGYCRGYLNYEKMLSGKTDNFANY